MVPANSHRISPVPRYSGYSLIQNYLFMYRALTVCGLPFQVVPLKYPVPLCKSFNPRFASTKLVWAAPRSLATTYGITIVFFSYGYLDVSVPHVRLRFAADNRPIDGWVAPFGNLRINAYLQLPEAYRSLSRPSSPLRAKASTFRSYSLLYVSYSI
jgi:hypothetical protein